MPASIDDTYHHVIFSLPSRLHAMAVGLLAEVGLAGPAGARWDEIFKLEPCRDLPIFAVAPDLPVEEQRLEAFRVAHHCACFCGVLADRLADRQVDPSPALDQLLAHFWAHWRRALGEADGDLALSDRAIVLGLRTWRRGVQLEQAALAGGSLSLRRYARIILLKLGWAGIASECLLRQVPNPRRARAFRHAYLLLMLGMQCIDDAADSTEDEALHGASFPAVLGFPPAGLFAAGGQLTRAAAAAAREGGFERLAQWSSERAEELNSLTSERVSMEGRLAGLVIASTLEETCQSIAERYFGNNAVTTSCARSTLTHRPKSSRSGITLSSPL
jgi:hypothetical protein